MAPKPAGRKGKGKGVAKPVAKPKAKAVAAPRPIQVVDDGYVELVTPEAPYVILYLNDVQQTVDDTSPYPLIAIVLVCNYFANVRDPVLVAHYLRLLLLHRPMLLQLVGQHYPSIAAVARTRARLSVNLPVAVTPSGVVRAMPMYL